MDVVAGLVLVLVCVCLEHSVAMMFSSHSNAQLSLIWHHFISCYYFISEFILK